NTVEMIAVLAAVMKMLVLLLHLILPYQMSLLMRENGAYCSVMGLAFKYLRSLCANDTPTETSLKNKVAQEKVLCVHLHSGALSDHDCQQLFSNITHTECSFQHFSSFAVLMATDHKQILCSVIAGMLKYLFLACFIWMFLEGVNLYLIVRNLKVANCSGASKYMKICMYLIGYGFPVLIIAISAAINPGAFGTLYSCWLNPDFIWSFTGLVCVIIVVNLVFFCLILKTLHEKLASLNSQISTVRNTRSLMFKAIAHVFILGVTWCFGLFQYGSLKDVMAYIFTIFNSAQGIFIFLVHCLLNQKVREAYWYWIYCKKDIRPPVSEITMNLCSHQQPFGSAILSFTCHFVRSAASVGHTPTAFMSSCRQSIHRFFGHPWSHQPSGLSASAHFAMDYTSALITYLHLHNLNCLILSGIGATLKAFQMSVCNVIQLRDPQ
ncbi:EMR3: EGF-like module-containing mucin-like hormone receptor-like 3, partial [Crotalus adamanteus]